MWKLKNLLLDVLALAAVKFFLGGVYSPKEDFLAGVPRTSREPRNREMV